MNKNIVVQKYGGTSVGDITRIQHVADKIIALKKEGRDVVVVLSAMSGETNRLIALAHTITPSPKQREMDRLMATGEMVTIALLAIALEERNCPAISFSGRQVGILTDTAHTRARIKEIKTEPIMNALKKGNVVVVAGFQGIDPEGNITTLGRGGSDTTAVAVAAALKASVCEILTDVDGVYTCDPRVVPDARRIEKISYDEMLELASLGAKVLHSRAVEFGRNYNVPILVKSSFTDEGGTLVTQEDEQMEKVVVAGISALKNQAKIKFSGVKDEPGIASKIFVPLASEGFIVDMIVQNVGELGKTDLSFTVDATDKAAIIPLLDKISEKIGAQYSIDSDISKVSIVGVGMRSHAGVASKMFASLADAGVNIMMISTSEIKISIIVSAEETNKAMQVLHDAFDLSEKTP